MAKKNSRNTKGRIIQAAWQLFYQQGYDDTTVEEIIEASGTSRGSFYHYFEGKDALLSSVSFLFDETPSPWTCWPGCTPPSWSPGGTSICWTTTAHITSCCGRSSFRGSSGES